MTISEKMRRALEVERDYLFQNSGRTQIGAGFAIQQYLNEATEKSLERLAAAFEQTAQ